ncbi:TIM barrel protein [Phytohabitans rumicis]|uniref:Inosose dehydratase n=1 Tax=Phytohabitans rumicis TaxID=1076125 RepID=A0A6V8L257_9ACTN|nr:TIM barrel protein [Phytohabitans rumicis]GFJ88187.1 inosose dehydratase [Phytohabitans rumicis]
MRIAGAPISWGVCEVPGWGHQLPPERVLAEMRALGLEATEFGPDGFLPVEPIAREALLAGLRAVGGFVPVVLHDGDPVPAIRQTAERFAADGADVVVLAADTGAIGYDSRPALDEAGWQTLLSNLDAAAAAVAEHGLTATLHPHVGTMVETADEVDRVLAGSSIPLCLDTGHLLVGGADPAEIAARVPERIAHVHLKDVDADYAAKVRAGELTYTEAVRAGMYRPLGKGDVDIAGIVRTLVDYQGWYVMEQDAILSGPEDDPLPDVRASVEYLRGL